MSKSGKFKYRQKSQSSLKSRANQSSGNFDRYVKEDVQMFRPQEGKNKIRILPDTWDGADHYAFEVFVHYGIGPDNQTYLCLNKNKGAGGGCPVCEEYDQMKRDGDADADQLKAKKRAAIWLIDRNKEEDGPQLWMMPWTLDKDIASRCIDDDTGEVIPIDHPEEGYDVSFVVEEKQFRNYVGVTIARRSTPISDEEDKVDEWLEYIMENPIPSVLNYYDADHISSVFHGEAATKTDDGDEEEESEAEGESAFTEEEHENDPFGDDKEDSKSKVASARERLKRRRESA